MRPRFLLAADIGGTFSRFALFRLEENASGPSLSLVPGSKIRLSTQAYASFAALLQRLSEEKTPDGYALLPSGQRPDYEIVAAAAAVPGPVADNRCRAANIPWELHGRDLAAAFGVPAILLNDFAAQAGACLFPELLGLHCLLSGQAKDGYPVALVGAGTGLGHALLLPGRPGTARTRKFNAGQTEESAAALALAPELINAAALEDLQRRVLPSEGGHTVFGCVGEAEAEFAAFACKRSGRRELIGDMAVTGYGLSLLYAFHSRPRNSSGPLLTPPEVSKLIDKRPDVLEWFARFYGRACRNFALATLSLGGVYLSGGLLSHVPGLLGHPAFAAEFRFSETKAYMLKDIPVCHAGNQDIGLWGAALAALRSVAPRSDGAHSAGSHFAGPGRAAF